LNPDIEVSAIVVTFNSEENIFPCLKSLMGEMENFRGELIVFDNNSTDATINAIKSVSQDIIIFKSERNIGFAAGNNRAVEMARGKYILLANPDLIPDPGCLQGLLSAFKSHSDAGAVVARLRNPDGAFQPTCRNLPNMSNIFFSRGSFLAGKKSGYTIGDKDSITSVPAAAATCMLMEKEYFLKLKGFDERFFLFMEDTDLSLRIKQTGKKVYFAPQAGAIHLWGRGSSVSKLKRRFHHHHSVWKYFIKHYPNGFSIFLLPLALSFNFIIMAFGDLFKRR